MNDLLPCQHGKKACSPEETAMAALRVMGWGLIISKAYVARRSWKVAPLRRWVMAVWLSIMKQQYIFVQRGRKWHWLTTAAGIYWCASRVEVAGINSSL